MRRRIVVACAVLSTACATRRVGGVAGTITTAYVYPNQDHTAIERVSIADGDAVLVGAVVVVTGALAATCKGAHPGELVPCAEEASSLKVTCRGACTLIDGGFIPSNRGPLGVDVELTSHETGRRYRVAREVKAVRAEAFELACTAGGKTVVVADTATCVTDQPTIRARVRAGDRSFAAILVLRGQPMMTDRDGAVIGVGTTPGTRRLELSYGALTRTATVEIVAPDNAAASP